MMHDFEDTCQTNYTCELILFDGRIFPKCLEQTGVQLIVQTIIYANISAEGLAIKLFFKYMILLSNITISHHYVEH